MLMGPSERDVENQSVLPKHYAVHGSHLKSASWEKLLFLWGDFWPEAGGYIAQKYIVSACSRLLLR